MRLAVIVLAVAIAGPTFAQPTAPAATPTPSVTPKKKAEDPNRIICKREHVVGSNRPQKVCMTVAERERLSDQSQRITDESRRVGVSRDNDGNVPNTPGG